MFGIEELLPLNAEFGFGGKTFGHARPSSFHRGGVVAAYCDTRCELLSDEIDYLVYCQLMTPDGRATRPAGTHGFDASGRARWLRDEDPEPSGPPFEGRSVYALSVFDSSEL